MSPSVFSRAVGDGARRITEDLSSNRQRADCSRTVSGTTHSHLLATPKTEHCQVLGGGADR